MLVPESRALAADEARFALKATRSGDNSALDGAWWPRSRDLATELPAFVAALAARGFATARVAYSRECWDEVLKRLPVTGRIIRLGWFRTIDPNSVSLTSRDGQGRIDLLVVPSASDAELATRAFERALDSGNRGGASATLTAAAAGLADSQTAAAAETVWESEGGSQHPKRAGAGGAMEPT